MTRLWFSSALLPDGWSAGVRITLSGGIIANVEKGIEPTPQDERHGPALPGLPNVHSHAFQRVMAGLTERRGGAGEDDFWTWREAMYRCVERLGPEEVEAVAALAYTEMLEAGFTRVGEFHYLHHDPDGRPYADVAEMAGRVMAAAREVGIGMTLLPVFYAHSGFGGKPPAAGQRRFVNDVDGFARLVEATRRMSGPDVIVGVAPHSLRAVTSDELREILPLAGGGPVHIHVAEQAREVDDCLAWSGLRPVQWLLDEQPVDGRWCLIHATHTTADERAGIVASSAIVGLCPITEANLGDGVFAAGAFREAAGAFGVGTDSNVLIDAAGELRMLEYGQRLTLRRRNVLSSADTPSTGRTLFAAAHHGGSLALGVEAGGLAVGQRADIVTLDPDHPALLCHEADALFDGWVFATSGGAIDRVWCGGRPVVVGGRHVLREALARRYRTTLNKLRG
jgi:formiminoglutamate deiminase